LPLLLSLTCLLLIAPAAAQTEPNADPSDDQITISYLFSDGNMIGTLEAYRSLIRQNPDLDGRISLQFLTESFLVEADPGVISNSDVLVLDMMNQSILDRFNAAHDIDLINEVTTDGAVIAVGSGVQPLDYFTGQGAVWDETALAYWQNGGQQNQLSLLKFSLQLAGVTGLTIPPPQPSLDFAYYYPGDAGGQAFEDWDEFAAWMHGRGLMEANKLRVAIGFYKSTFYGSETEVVDAIIAEIERAGAIAIPFFGFPGHLAFEHMLIDENGAARADVGLSFLMRFANFDSSRSLANINIPIINLATLYGRSEQEWRQSSTGLSLFEGTFQVAVPELAGLIAPTVVGSRERQFDAATNISIVVDKPIAPRIEMAVMRGLRYARLAQKPMQDRRIAMMFYNYPVGKASIGASYLNIAESLENILSAMRDSGYDLGDADLSADSILADITSRARNIGSYAPGDMEEMLAFNSFDTVTVETYNTWLDALEPSLRNKILQDWGDPAEEDLMTYQLENHKIFVIPRLEYGNIILMPQPVRGWSEDLEKLYHADDLAPHHQYVAAYSWLRHEIDIDAIIHMGTHGTLEWLDGKDTGLSAEDAPDALLADIPNINIYNVDVVGEGLIARRRGMATLVDHMVPPFIASDLYSDLAALSESINDYHNNLHKNEALAKIYARQIVEQVQATGIAKSLGIALTLDASDLLEHELLHEIQDHMVALRSQFIPYGLHTFGELPTEEMRRTTVAAIFAADRSQLSESEFYYSQQIEDSIIESAGREIGSLLNSLSGGFVGAGSGGEPIRNPDAYPTGKNFYGIDPDKVPKKAAWELGVKLADQMLADHLAEHGEYPQKISFVIWGDETMRHEGIVESQIFYLLGTRPVWDGRDKVVGIEVIAASELGRPRIDIIIASAAEGMFNNVTVLMDQAVQKVKALQETENFVRDHYLATRAALMDSGYSEEDADRRAGVRIFDEPPGTYSLNTSNIAAASGTWDSDLGMVNDYINKMGHGFGNGFWGEPMQDVFKLALAGVDKVVHSSSTMLYGALDNDDFFMYMGGLAAAIKTVDGDAPDLLVTNTRNPSQPEMSSIDKFIGMEFNTRYINPTWIRGMQAEGYAGARNMVEFVEYMWGWDATVSETIDDNMWQQSFAVYVQDKYELGMEEFFDDNSPYAFQDLSVRMLETIRKQYWDADQETLTELLKAYVDSVNKHGINCTEVSCDNPRLMEYVLLEGENSGLSGLDLSEFRQAVETAIQASIETLARAAENFANNNDARIAELYETAATLQGFAMEPIEQPQAQAQPLQIDLSALENSSFAYIFQGLVLLLLLFWWFRRRMNRPTAV